MEDRGFSDLLSTANSILNSQSHASAPSSQSNSSQSYASTPSSTIPATSSTAVHHGRPPSYGDVMASAQVIMNAAKAKMQHEESGASAEEIDMGKVAGAASTIIGAAAHYGKLDNTAYGKYAQKAEDYLQSYESKHKKPAAGSAQTTAHSEPPQAAYHSSDSQAYASGQGQSAPSQGQYSQGYSQPSQGSRPAGSQGYSEGYSEPYKSRPAESQNYPAGYPPAGYPTSDNRPKRNYY